MSARNHVAAAAIVALVSMVIAGPVSAEVHTYRVGFNVDNNPDTGCDMAVDEQGYGGGPIPGIEVILNFVVDTALDPPMVVESTVEECFGSWFLAPVVIDDADRSVDTNAGSGGSDVVDGILPASYLNNSRSIGLAFASLTETGGEDLVLDDGSVFRLDQISSIPTLGQWGLLLFAVLLATTAFHVLRRRRSPISVVLVMVILVVGVAVAIAFSSGDPSGDSTSGEPAADIVGVSADFVGGDVWVVFEIDELENLAPEARNDGFTTDEDTPVAGDLFADNGSGVDADPEGDSFSVIEINGNPGDVGVQIVLPSGALLTVDGNGSFSYDPNGQFEDLGDGDAVNDSFTYTVQDSHGNTATATVTVTVDGVDDGCPDADGDGYHDLTCGGTDCDDTNPDINPGATEICDGLDNNCDGRIDDLVCACADTDGDGHESALCGGSDCNDFNRAINPGATEICDGLDNNCDGNVDEGFPPDCVPCTYLAQTVCSPGDIRACGTDVGQCVAGVELCDESGQWSGACTGELGPVDEIRDGLDNNCNGTADEGFWSIEPVCTDTGIVWRVDGGAAVGGDGLSWSTAFLTLEAALAAAGPCDEIWVRGGTFSLADTVAIVQDIRIYGGFAGDETERDERDPVTNITTFDGGGAAHCFAITADTLLDGVTVANCHSDETQLGGAIHVTGAALHLRGATFVENRADSEVLADRPYGGAVYAEANATVSIEDTRFEANYGHWFGGAVAAVDSTVLVRDSQFVENRTRDAVGSVNVFARGGAIYSSGAGTVTVVDTVFEGNRSWMEGGAIFVYETDLYVMGSTFRGNVSRSSSSGIQAMDASAVVYGSLFEANGTPADDIKEAVVDGWRNSALTVSDCDFVDNDDTALSVYGSVGYATLDIADTRFLRNQRSLGSAAATLTVFRSRVEDDRSLIETATVYGPEATFAGCTFHGNEGRAIDFSGGTARIEDSVFLSNHGHFYGGALHVDSRAEVDVTNSVFADNFCAEEGSAAFVDDHSTLRMAHVTIVGNSVADDFGAIIRLEYYSSAELTNGLVWGNHPVAASWDSSSNRLNPTYSVVPYRVGWDNPTLHNLIVDPKMMDPAAGDYRLAPWSPVIDAGTTAVPDPPGLPTVDLVGRARALDGDGNDVDVPDPGALEYVYPLPNTPPVSLAEDGMLVNANGVPLSIATLHASRSCDPENDTLTHLWYGPRGQLEGPSPEVWVPEGTSVFTLVSHDGGLPSDPKTITAHTSPCRSLTATVEVGVASLSWTGLEAATVFRAPESDPTRFRIVADDVLSVFEDRPPPDLEVALYAIVTGDEGARCASNVVAVHLGDPPPAHGAPVIYSTPSDYGESPGSGPELATVYEALFGIPYGYHVLAADPEADPLSFALLEGPATTAIDAVSGLLMWTPDQTGHHEVIVRVTDGLGGVATQMFTLRIDNRPPVANAGRDVTLAEAGGAVTLDGSGSSDPDGDALSFDWRLVAAPAHSAAVLSDSAAEQPEITPDLPGRYTLELVVGDGSEESLPDVVMVATMDILPVAVTNYPNIPGEFDSTHQRGDLVQLDGSGSWDPEGRPLSYLWTWRSRPEGSTAALADPTDPRPTFVADVFGRYNLELVVSDGPRGSFPGYAYTAARNRDPVADAGPDRAAAIGERVTFDCSLSYDPDGEALICRWYLVPPGGSSAWLEGQPPGSSDWFESFEASFVPDVPGSYLVMHQVEDPSGRRSRHDAYVTVAAGTHPPIITTSPLLTASEDLLWSYPAAADDPDASDTESWSLDQAPAGMDVDPGSGSAAWTPGADQIGDHDVVLRVTDGSGLFDLQAFTVEVTATARPPRIGCPAAMTVAAGDTLARGLEAHDPNAEDVGILTFEKLAGPESLTIAGDTGLVLWEPTEGDVGDHIVDVRVVDSSDLEAACTFTVTVVAATALDGDFDGVTVADGDCNDEDPSIHPGAWDVAGDGIDQDCVDGDALRSVSVEGPTEVLELLVGETALVPHVVYIDRTDTAAGGVMVTQEVLPADGGLVLESDLSATPAVIGSQTRLAGATLTAETPGDYELVTSITDLDTGQVAEAVTPVRVLAGTTRARMLPPGFSPGAVPISEAVLVDVTVRFLHGDPSPEFLRLDETNDVGTVLETVGWLMDNGEGVDLAAGDGVYSGTIEVQADTEGSLWFRAKTNVPAGEVPLVSELGELPATRFPVGAPNADLDDLVFSPTSGAPLLAGRVSVVFNHDTTPDAIEAAAIELGGSVSGFLPALGVHVLSMPPVLTGDELVARLDVVLAHSDIDAVAASGVVRAQAVSVPDPNQDEMAWPATITVPNAWVFGFGGRTSAIAVVDSGIDSLHPDLRYNYRPGDNVFCTPTLCTGIEDDNAHGTTVSGVIAADSNSVGIAGILPEARLYVVKGLDLNGEATTEDLADAVTDALNHGAKLINISAGQYPEDFTDPLLMSLIDYRVASRGALLVAAAGNENTRRRLYPAATPSTLAVGGVGLDPTVRWDRSPLYRGTGSNYGDWVDLAAPADDIFTTAPTTSLTAWRADLYCIDYDDPGALILTTLAERRSKGCYTPISGTSLATPMVVGAGGLLLARFPHLTARDVRRRLEQTAQPLTNRAARGLGNGLLDVYQVVFNGSFEADEAQHSDLARVVRDLSGEPCVDFVAEPTCCFDWALLERPCYQTDSWRPDNHGWHLLRYGGVDTAFKDFRRVDHVPGGVRIRRLGPIVPPDGELMAFLSTGRAEQTEDSIYYVEPEVGDYFDAHYLDILEQRFTVAPGQESLDIGFQYDFVTEEQAWVGDRTDTPAPDYFSVVLEIGDQREMLVYGHVFSLEAEGALDSLDGATLTEGVPLLHTGWVLFETTIPLDTDETGPITLRFAISDGWDRAFDSVLLVDDVRVK